jgi:hypothetical protein
VLVNSLHALEGTAVQENAARKVDIIKIWVDDRMGTVKKLSPELYGAVIDEAHRHGMRVIAHIYTLDDAKATLAAEPRRRTTASQRRRGHGQLPRSPRYSP